MHWYTKKSLYTDSQTHSQKTYQKRKFKLNFHATARLKPSREFGASRWDYVDAKHKNKQKVNLLNINRC